MARSIGNTLAVPQAALRYAGDKCTLAFETRAWKHFTSYIGKVEQLPPAFNGKTSEVAAALGQIRLEVQRFGSPSRLRQLLRDQPDLLAAQPPPTLLYAGLLHWIVHLQRSSTMVETVLHSLLEPLDASSRKEGLRMLGELASEARNQLGPLMAPLESFKLAIVSANGDLAAACKGAGALLQGMQEGVGGTQARIKNHEAKIADLGLFGAHKKQELLAQLHPLQKELADSTARAGKLQDQLALLEPILDEGAWLELDMGELLDLLERLRTAWTAFGSSMAQLAADATDAQLADPGWIEQALEGGEAIKQWAALDQAAGRFMAESLVDFPDHASRNGSRT